MLSNLFEELPTAAPVDPCAGNAALLRQMDSVKQKMKLAEELFDLSESEDLTDACIYQIKALASYYRYLLEEARKSGCRSGPVKKPAGPLRAAGLL